MKRQFLAATLWASAASVWTSMGHALLSTPDVTLIVGPLVFATMLLAPLAKRPAPSPAIRHGWRIS